MMSAQPLRISHADVAAYLTIGLVVASLEAFFVEPEERRDAVERGCESEEVEVRLTRGHCFVDRDERGDDDDQGVANDPDPLPCCCGAHAVSSAGNMVYPVDGWSDTGGIVLAPPEPASAITFSTWA